MRQHRLGVSIRLLLVSALGACLCFGCEGGEGPGEGDGRADDADQTAQCAAAAEAIEAVEQRFEIDLRVWLTAKQDHDALDDAAKAENVPFLCESAGAVKSSALTIGKLDPKRMVELTRTISRELGEEQASVAVLVESARDLCAPRG